MSIVHGVTGLFYMVDAHRVDMMGRIYLGSLRIDEFDQAWVGWNSFDPNGIDASSTGFVSERVGGLRYLRSFLTSYPPRGAP